MNDRSSRSHSIFQLKLDGKNSITGEHVQGLLNLIDLAGSEKLSQSGATGNAKTEAIHINQSLTTLGNVIAAIGMRDEAVRISYPKPMATLTFRIVSPSLPECYKTPLGGIPRHSCS